MRAFDGRTNPSVGSILSLWFNPLATISNPATSRRDIKVGFQGLRVCTLFDGSVLPVFDGAFALAAA
jgi:hypothetical protein